MRSLVLVLATAALLAPARPKSISQPDSFNKKLDDAVKDVFDIDAQTQNADDVDQANTIKDFDNTLQKRVPEPIPVKVVVEDVQPALKADENKDAEKVDDTDVKRVEVDLKHPGEPEHQEHNTQNPEHFDDEQGALASIRQMIKDTQAVFNDGFKDVSERIEDWLKDNKPEITIKDSIENLQESFMENIHKLNATIQSYWNKGSEVEKPVDINKVQSSLKVLEEKFENGVETLNHGVRILAVQKSETRDDTTSTTAKPSGFPFPGFMTNIWNSVSQSFGNVTNQFQNLVGQNNSTQQGAAGTQSDEQSGATSRPTVWQGIQNQIQTIFQSRPGQNQQNQQQGIQNDEQPASQPSGPFAQVIQNVPFLQNIANLIQPKPQTAEPSKPVESGQPSAGSNIVPAPESAQSASEPAKPDQQQKKPDQEIQPAQAPGPIQQIIQKNPIVQSISGAVQKIQHTITNPEKPREEPVEKKEGAEKGGFYGGHHGQRPGDGNNNDVSASGVVKSAPIEAEKRVPSEAENVQVEAVKSAPVEAESAPIVPAEVATLDIECSPIEPAKSAPVEAESAPIEAANAPVEALKPQEPLLATGVVKQD